MGKTSKFQFKRTVLTAAVSSIAILSVAPISAAQTSDQSEVVEVPVNIPAGPMSQTILAISDAFGVDILAPTELVSGKTASAVTGATSAENALNRAFAGSGLTYTSTDGALVVTREPAQVPLEAEPGTPNAPEIQDEEPAIQDTIIVRGIFQDSLIDRLPLTVRELPFTLNTVTREDIDQRGFVRPIDVLDTLPNVQIAADNGSFGNPRFLVRGFDADVLVNNRDVNPFSRDLSIQDDAFVERYEVLKGPASIALGPTTGGGVINTVLKEPADTDFTELFFSADQFGSVEAEVDYNDAELFGSDRVGVRISAATRDFRFDAEELSREELAIRGVVTADITANTTARASFSFKDAEAPPNNFFPLLNDGTVPSGFDTDTFFATTGAFQSGQTYFSEAQVVYDFLDNLTLTVRGSYQDNDIYRKNRNGLYNYLFDDGLAGVSPDNLVGQGFNLAQDAKSNTSFFDAQLLYTVDFGGLEQSFVVGASQIEDETRQFTTFGGLTGPFRFDDLDTPRFGDPELVPPSDFNFGRDSELSSVFAEAALRPFTGFTLIGGIRYDELSETNVLAQTTEETESTTVRIGGSYEIRENISLFASYAESFFPQSGIRRDGSQVGPEDSNNYEFGLKGTFFDEAVFFDVAAFFTKRENVSVRDPANLPGEVFVVAIGEQENQGFEATVGYRPGNGFSLEATYGHLEQELVANLEGGFVAPAPENQLSAFATYEVQTGSLAGLTFGGGLRIWDSRPVRSPGVEVDGATVFDGLVSYPVSDTTSLRLNVLNVADELYLEAAGGNGILTGRNNFGAPRTFVVSLQTRF